MNDCIFCKIIAGEIPSTKVAEDNMTFVFEDINPQAPIHLLIVPKKHIDFRASENEVDFTIFQHLLAMAKKVAIQKGIEQNGFRLIVNSGPDAGQEVDHFHMHLLGGKKLGRMISQ